MNLGFIGLGAMGSAMAARLLEQGHTVRVYNRTPGKDAILLEQGAIPAATPAEAAASGLVLTMLTDDAAVHAVCAGPHGILAGLPEGGVHVSCGTISLTAAQSLARMHEQAGRGFVSATVLGRPPAIPAGKLYVMAAGAPAAFATARPVLESLGQRLFELGADPAHANLVKLCCNFLIFSTIEQMAEIFAITEKAGVDRAALYELLTESFFSAPVHRNYGTLIRDRAYGSKGTDVTLALKDTAMMLEAARTLTAPMPLASLVRDRLLACAAHGETDRDFAILAKEAERSAGLE